MRSEVDLDPGERLIWAGTPHALRYGAAMAWQSFVSGIVVCGFALCWMRFGALIGFPFTPFGILVLISGATLLLSPAWHFLRGLRASYALTDRRAILDFATQRISVPLAQVQYVDVRPSRSGRGDIYFKDTYVPTGDSQTLRRNGFVAIDEVEKVEQLLRAAIGKIASPERTR